LAKADHLILTVTKNNVNGEFHKKHVDGLTARYDQGVPLGMITSPKQAFHPCPRVLGNFNTGSDNKITGEICDHDFQKRFY